MAALDQLAAAHVEAQTDPAFLAELDDLLTNYAGRPTPLTEAKRFSAAAGGGARVLLKREDLAHTGSHKVNNVLGQALLTRRWASSGSSPRPVPASTAWRPPPPRSVRLRLHRLHGRGGHPAAGPQRRPDAPARRSRSSRSRSGTKTLKDATNEAFRDWVANVETTHYAIGSVVGPHPFPMLVRDFQRIIGVEARQQVP